MTYWEIFALLVTGGVIGTIITVLGNFGLEWYREKQKVSADEKKRSNESSNERLATKKRVYEEMLNTMNFAVLHRMSGGGNYEIGKEEATKRTQLITDVGLYGSEEVKKISARIAGYLKIGELNGLQQSELVQLVRELTDQVRSEIEH